MNAGYKVVAVFSGKIMFYLKDTHPGDITFLNWTEDPESALEFPDRRSAELVMSNVEKPAASCSLVVF